MPYAISPGSKSRVLDMTMIEMWCLERVALFLEVFKAFLWLMHRAAGLRPSGRSVYAAEAQANGVPEVLRPRRLPHCAGARDHWQQDLVEGAGADLVHLVDVVADNGCGSRSILRSWITTTTCHFSLMGCARSTSRTRSLRDRVCRTCWSTAAL